ncbi:transglycosylase domain-containing protein [Alicyclobacillus tolerans]|uniref:Penicillin-binding protein/penicillin-binding protein 1A n=1 Tax=Alicyclobacillus tolerans TaxID=90970 RepID=A0A1M6KCI3_9BACL|nr:transglycosylase domain-containing protein [Alicyclobacillus montanus]SHJ56629.1 penicillin-binding protein/penicillin-binding protein 1A [Alicyclobacillus montanus]
MTKRYKHRQKRRSKVVRWQKGMRFVSSIVAGVCVSTALFLIGAAGGYSYVAAHHLPTLDVNRLASQPHITEVYDRNGKWLGNFARSEDFESIHSLQEVSPLLVQAYVDAEDKTFFKNPGIAPLSLLRACYQDVVWHHIVSGASTITQQTIKLVYFPEQQRTLERKLEEAVLAIEANHFLSKQEILIDYLNHVYFGKYDGKQIYGVKAAAHIMLGKSLQNLTPAEAAFLATIPNNPSEFHPIQHPHATLTRCHWILGEMYRCGTLSKAEYQQALNEPILKELKHPNMPLFGNHPYLMLDDIQPLVAQLLVDHGLYANRESAINALPFSGLRIYTTVDAHLQNRLEDILANNPSLSNCNLPNPVHPQQYDLLEAGMTLIDNHSGGILAMSGGRDYRDDQIDHANLARQPGSAIKPILDYAPAIDCGQLTAASILSDRPTIFSKKPLFAPKDDDGKFRGDVSVREALIHSFNVPAVETLQKISPQLGFAYLERLGLPIGAQTLTGGSSLVEKDVQLASAIGGMTHGLSVTQLTDAYTALANQGIWRQAYLIEKITDANGHLLYQAKPVSRRVFRPSTAFIVTSMLEDVVKRGTGWHIHQTYPHINIAGKTGTTDNEENGWFIGYTPDYTLGVWTGYNHNQSIPMRVYQTKMKLWEAMMKPLLNAQANFPVPETVTSALICKDTGELANLQCLMTHRAVKEYFERGSVPDKICSRIHSPIQTESKQIPSNLPVPLPDDLWPEASQPPDLIPGLTQP